MLMDKASGRPPSFSRSNFGVPKKLLLLVVASLSIVAPSLSAAESFSSDKPSGLKLANARHGRVAHFAGIVRLYGQFLVKWDFVDNKPHYLRAVFFPDKDSMALLPHVRGEGPVKELLFPNANEAATILLDSKTAQRIFAKELFSAGGEATVMIGHYRTVVDCDHRWYLAELISASRPTEVVEARKDGRFGC